MPDLQDLFKQATDLVELGLLYEALAIFQTIVKTDSNNTIVWNNIGIIQFKKGEYREALNAFGHGILCTGGRLCHFRLLRCMVPHTVGMDGKDPHQFSLPISILIASLVIRPMTCCSYVRCFFLEQFHRVLLHG